MKYILMWWCNEGVYILNVRSYVSSKGHAGVTRYGNSCSGYRKL